MSAAGWTILAWGTANLILATLLFAFPHTDTFSFVEAYGAAVAVLAVGALLVLVARRRRRRQVAEAVEYDTGARLLADVSYPTTLLGLSLAALLLSAEFSWWLTLIAGGLLVVAAGGLLRERRAMRREPGRTDSHGVPTEPAA